MGLSGSGRVPDPDPMSFFLRVNDVFYPLLIGLVITKNGKNSKALILQRGGMGHKNCGCQTVGFSVKSIKPYDPLG